MAGGKLNPLYMAVAEMAAAAREIHTDAKRNRVQEFVVDNTRLQSGARGLAFRLSKNLDDKDPGQLAEWGSTVFGIGDEGWLRVGARYLPFTVDDCPVLLAAAVADRPEARAVVPYASVAAGLREPRPYEGTFVELVGVDIAPAVRTDGTEGDDVDVECRYGFCLGCRDTSNKYVVRTLEGDVVAVSEDHLLPWAPPAAAQGGFDVPWMGGALDAETFSTSVCECISQKGYCVVQTFWTPKEREEALDSAEEGRTFRRLKQELESGYLGLDNHTKVAPLWPDAERGADGLLPDAAAELQRDASPDGVLQACSQQMTDLSLLMSPWTPFLGFACYGLMSTMVRTSIDRMEEDEFFPESLQDDEDESEIATVLEAYVRFVARRKLCILSTIHNEGGDFWLYPRGDFVNEMQAADIHMPLSPNKIIVFRHDWMDYSYQVSGPSVALQTWVLDEPPRVATIKNLQLSLSRPGKVGEVITNPGVLAPEAPTASVLAIGNRMSGEVWNPDHWWNVFVGGTDCDVKWPAWRFEAELYYDPGDSLLTGKSYTCHMGALSLEQMTSFDNAFFGIEEKEAMTMLPGQRLVLEVGYATLYKCGLNRESLRGRRTGCWLGDVGPDWHSWTSEWPRYLDNPCAASLATSMSCICTAGRISHIFDMRGPVSSYDTACSSSLVALNQAHIAMFRAKGVGEAPSSRVNRAGRVGEDCTEALVGGINTLLGPESFIGNCMAGMLTRKGRCFTFTDSADGYQRADACGMMLLRLFVGDKSDKEQRMCALTGTGANADGKSASLTAPSGPAQQKLLRKSIAFSGIEPGQISYAECHGTGTSLGDPIEVGAMSAVLCEQRAFPLLVGSHKSNTGHSEAGAGISGLTKCILFLGMQAVPPNVHLNTLNPNISAEGLPMLFASEAIDSGFSDCFCGVCSFGFGGSNARADVSGHAWRGPRERLLVELPRVTMPREITFGKAMFISGSWSGWSRRERMHVVGDGKYMCYVMLGVLAREEFQFLTSPAAGDDALAIHPLVPRAGSGAQIVGPDSQGRDLHFLIDGLSDGLTSGAVYEVNFDWTQDARRVSWRPAEPVREELPVYGGGFEHRYYLAGTFLRADELQMLVPCKDGGFEGTFKMGVRSEEEFWVVCDGSNAQLIFPEQRRASGPCQVFGPSSLRGDRSWAVRGAVHQVVTVNLSIVSGLISVTVKSPATGTRTWLSG